MRARAKPRRAKSSTGNNQTRFNWADEIAAIRQAYGHLFFLAGQELCVSRRRALVARLRRDQSDAIQAIVTATRYRRRAARALRTQQRMERVGEMLKSWRDATSEVGPRRAAATRCTFKRMRSPTHAPEP
jgi:hypothetical protein